MGMPSNTLFCLRKKKRNYLLRYIFHQKEILPNLTRAAKFTLLIVQESVTAVHFVLVFPRMLLLVLQPTHPDLLFFIHSTVLMYVFKALRGLTSLYLLGILPLYKKKKHGFMVIQPTFAENLQVKAQMLRRSDFFCYQNKLPPLYTHIINIFF